MSLQGRSSLSKDQLLDELKSLMGSFFYGLKQLVHHVKFEESLGEGQIFLLHVLTEHGAVKVSDIAERLGITAGAVTGITDKLLSMGLVQRERSEEDRRVVWVSPTEKGREVVTKVQSQRFELLRKRFSNLNEEDLKKAVEVFSMLSSELNSNNHPE